MTRGRRIPAVLIAGSLLCGAAAQAAVDDLDEARSAWRYRREVETHGGCFAALSLPPDLSAHSQAGFADLRLLWPNGTEVPYVVDRLVRRDVRSQWEGALVDVTQERRRLSRWTVDLGQARSFDAITLEIPAEDFAKRLLVERSDDRVAWHIVREDVGVFDETWGGRIHHTRIELDQLLTARFLRLTADDRRSHPITVTGVTVTATRRLDEETWSRTAAVVPLSSESVSRYRLSVTPGLRFEWLTLAADDLAFHRRVVIYEAREVNGRHEERSLGDARLFRLDLRDEAVRCESLRLRVAAPSGGELILEVHDGDSPPLRNLRVSVGGVLERILFPAVNPKLVLFYGNPRTHAPLYDLRSLSQGITGSLEDSTCWRRATLGEEAENPRFHPAPPLPFAPLVGAVLDASRWQVRRSLQAASGEDVYTLTLAARDLAHLRDDFGDLRLVDPEGRQVPFIFEADAGEDRVTMTIEPLARVLSPSGQSIQRSRYRLRVPPVESAASSALPLSALLLTFKESFFQRRAVLTAAPGPGSDPGRPRVLFRGGLGRASDETFPITITLDGSRLAEMQLEIDEGDNAPLTLAKVEAVVRVPRIAFKAASGSYQLLLGNRDAEPPSYDLAALRREVLCYSARPVSAGPAEANPAFRRGVADYFRVAPPTALLWAVLIAAVAALLYLTVRILRHASPAGDDSGDKTG